MTEVDSAPRGHPGPLQEDADNELDWMLQKNDESSPRKETSSPDSLPARSHTPSGSNSGYQQKNASSFPVSPTPAVQPLHTDDADDIDRFRAPRSVLQPDDSGDDGEYDAEMTADQKMAMKELQEMKLDLAYAEEEPPEYDVTERVRQLNEELAKEPSPTEHHRAIKFNENPVSLIVPPPEYPSDEEETKTNKQSQGQGEGQSMEVLRDESDVESDRSKEIESVEKDDDLKVSEVVSEVVSDHEEEEEVAEEVSDDEERERKAAEKVDDDNDDVDSKSDAQTSDTNTYKQQDTKVSDGGGEKVLVERNGKFELVEVNTLSPEERELYLVDYNQNKTSKDSHSVSSKASSDNSQSHSNFKSRPHRPATAAPNQTRSRNEQRRVQSAQPRQVDYTTYEDYGYKSPYALTGTEKEQLKREQKRKEDQKKKKEEDDKKQRKHDQDDAEDAFQSWLKQKRREASLRRKEDNQHHKSSTDKDSPDKQTQESEDAFSSWLQAKKQDSKKSRSVERAIRREQQEQYNLRPRTECDKAFKSWLRKKNTEVQKSKSDELNRNRVVRLLQRRSRKSQQLAQAMTHAQSFKYVDYYGYRY